MGIDDLGSSGNGAGRSGSAMLGQDQPAIRSDRGKGRAFGNSMASGFAIDEIGRSSELGVSRSSRAAAKKRAGTPKWEASACTAGSAAFRSMEATQATESSDNPASARQDSARAISSAAGANRSQPTPITTVAG